LPLAKQFAAVLRAVLLRAGTDELLLLSASLILKHLRTPDVITLISWSGCASRSLRFPFPRLCVVLVGLFIFSSRPRHINKLHRGKRFAAWR
jgi:hypothetical protein